MPAARKVRPKMSSMIVEAIRPVRMLRRASLRSMTSASLQPGVGHHRAEQEREVEEGEQVGLERRAAVRRPLEPYRVEHEDAAQHDRHGGIERAEEAEHDRQQREHDEQAGVEDD